MKEGDIIPVALELTVRYKMGSTGLLVGFIREFPFITCQAKTFDELVNELRHDLLVYVNKFPEGKKQLEKHGRVVIDGKKILDTNVRGEKAPPLEIDRPEIGFDEVWEEKKTMLIPV